MFSPLAPRRPDGARPAPLGERHQHQRAEEVAAPVVDERRDEPGGDARLVGDRVNGDREPGEEREAHRLPRAGLVPGERVAREEEGGGDDEERAAALKEFDGDEESALFSENYGFQIPQDCHWSDVRAVTTNVGQALQAAMRGIEQANPHTLYGIFGDAQWTNKDRCTPAFRAPYQ